MLSVILAIDELTYWWGRDTMTGESKDIILVSDKI